jgi:O-antigen ligase
VITRAHGTFPHPNIFGGFLFVSLLMTQFLFLKEKKKLLAVAIFFQIFTLFLTFSRAAILAYLMGSALLFFYSRKLEWKSLAKVIGFSLVFSLFFLLPALQDRGGIFNYNATVQSSDQGRVLFHEIAFNMIKEHPLLGVGFNHFLVRMQEFSPVALAGDQFFPVHNIYLLIASEEGVIGLLLFSLFLGSILFGVFKSEMTLERATLLSIFVGFLLIGCFDFYLLAGTQHGRLLFFMIAGLLSFSAKRDNVSI